jgi:hypothetical protein
MLQSFALRATEETFLDLEPLILRTVGKIHRSMGGDVDELRGLAAEIFLDAYRTWSPDRGSFRKWVSFRVWTGLTEVRRTSLMRAQRLKRIYPDMRILSKTAPTFHIQSFMSDLSQDAQFILHLITYRPMGLERKWYSKAVGEREPQPRNLRTAIKTLLRELGWSSVRITASFNEIKTALCED